MNYSELKEKFNKILVVLAHPDDFEVMFGGTMAMLAREGKEIYLLLLTKGARGSGDNTIEIAELEEVRLEEQKQAFIKLGLNINNIIAMDYKDGEIVDSIDLVGEVVKVIRKVKPDLVATFDPVVHYEKSPSKEYYFIQHRDHRHTGIVMLDAVYPFSRDRSCFSEHFDEGLSSHYVYDLLLVGDNQNSNLIVEIDSVIDEKRQAILEHKSQFTEEQVDKILQSRKENNKFIEKFKYLNLKH